jgi:hypothetical protein
MSTTENQREQQYIPKLQGRFYDYRQCDRRELVEFVHAAQSQAT